MKKKISSESFPILIDILPQVDLTFDSFNSLINNKYGKYGIDYFFDRMQKELTIGENEFFSDLELIFSEIFSDDISEIISKDIQLREDIDNDELLKEVNSLEKNINDLNNKVYDLSKSILNNDKIKKLKKDIYFLEQEYNYKKAIINKRADNYYEFQRALKEARNSSSIKSKKNISKPIQRI